MYKVGLHKSKSRLLILKKQIKTLIVGNNQAEILNYSLNIRFCLYPIDIVIQFEKKIILKKVQLLSHQYLIASKIEFYIGDCPDEEVKFESAKYTRLGYFETELIIII